MVSKVEAVVEQNIKEGKITPETGKSFLHKYVISRKILALYKKIEKKENSRLTPHELRGMGIELIPWNIKTTDGQPVFFKQFPLDDFRLYEVPKVDIHDLLDIRDFCYAARVQLAECFGGAEHVKTQKSLVDGTGWHAEEFDRLAVSDLGKEDNPDRYEWRAYGMLGQAHLPHTIVGSRHLCSEPELILRSELMILLLTMHGKGLKEEWLRDEISPVLLISIQIEHLRVIEAYYDGSNVVVRFSDPIPLKLSDSCEKQQETVNWILRWLVAAPVGDTSKFSSLKTENVRV